MQPEPEQFRLFAIDLCFSSFSVSFSLSFSFSLFLCFSRNRLFVTATTTVRAVLDHTDPRRARNLRPSIGLRHEHRLEDTITVHDGREATPHTRIQVHPENVLPYSWYTLPCATTHIRCVRLNTRVYTRIRVYVKYTYVHVVSCTYIVN